MARDDRLYDLLDHVLADLLERDLRAVLGGDDHRVHAHRLVLLVVLDRDLALAVRAEIVEHTVLAHLGEAFCQLVRQRDGQRHELGRLVARIAEHHALIARTDREVGVGRALLALERVVNAQRDIRGLLVDCGQHRAGVAVKAVLRAVIADLADGVAHDLGNVHIAGGRDLAHDLHHAGGAGGLAGDARIGVLR